LEKLFWPAESSYKIFTAAGDIINYELGKLNDD
jgi:hypothetical protein